MILDTTTGLFARGAFQLDMFSRHPRIRGCVAFYQYLEQADVHVIDCAGTVDLPLGLARVATLERELSARPARGACRKLLVDLRDLIWASAEAHVTLSAITRRAFGLDSGDGLVRVAFVHPGRSGVVAANEAWFADEREAFVWLVGE